MSDIKDIKMLIICILVADILGGVIYGVKGNIVGIFNCISWSVVAAFVLFNFKNIIK
ncbi:MAG: hypothetical protein PHC34_10540 [Candidatus Gastranaerophilales bacterium]|nr:hypothetical protein [Candidatus Gastranaerophilales bacterium]